MTINELLAQADQLEQKIAGETGNVRYELHQKLHRTLENIRLQGGKVPTHLRSLDLELVDEEVEDSFDNMPI